MEIINKQFSEDITEEVLIQSLEGFYKEELAVHEAKEEKQFNLQLKNLSFDLRVAAFKHALSYKDLIDTNMILNIFNLIKGYNTFDDSFFASEAVFVNNLEEFLDLKTNLAAELNEFTKELARYYVSILKTVGVTDFPANNLPEVIPFIYQRVLFIADFISMSNIIRKLKNIDNLVYVENAEMFLSSLANRYVFANFLMKNAGVSL